MLKRRSLSDGGEDLGQNILPNRPPVSLPEEQSSVLFRPDPTTSDPAPGGDNKDFARGGETPRERETQKEMTSTLRPAPVGMGGGGGGPVSAAPARPRVPTPQAGTSFMQASTGPTPGTAGVLPFSPMASPNVGSMATPRGGSLYGSMGGLKGGGLGVPLDPISNETSDPISSLIAMLNGKLR